MDVVDEDVADGWCRNHGGVLQGCPRGLGVQQVGMALVTTNTDLTVVQRVIYDHVVSGLKEWMELLPRYRLDLADNIPGPIGVVYLLDDGPIIAYQSYTTRRVASLCVDVAGVTVSRYVYPTKDPVAEWYSYHEVPVMELVGWMTRGLP